MTEWHSIVCGFLGGSVVKNLPANAGDTGVISGSGRFPGGGNGNPLPLFAWKIPWTEEPNRLQFMGSQRVGHNLATECTHTHTHTHTPRILYPFICQWTFRLFPCLIYCKSAAMNMGTCIFLNYICIFWITYIFSGYIPEVGLLDHRVALFLVFFKGNPILFFIVTILIYISINRVGGFLVYSFHQNLKIGNILAFFFF